MLTMLRWAIPAAAVDAVIVVGWVRAEREARALTRRTEELVCKLGLTDNADRRTMKP